MRQTNGNMIPISDIIEEKVQNIHGWSPLDQLYSLYLLAFSTNQLAGSIVEVGSWSGRSAVVLGEAAREIGNTKVFAIDYFPNKDDWNENLNGTYEFKMDVEGVSYLGHHNQTVWKEPFEESILPFYDEHPNLLEHFQDNIKNNSLAEIVTPIKGNTNYFADCIDPSFKCKLLYIDGEHSYESVKNDIEIMKKYLVKGGVICFDDAFTTYDGVDRAIEELIINSDEFIHCNKLTRKLFVAIKN
ncbi:MAG: class I SAM-dependent methyltransferase [Ignavibacteriae bacterium]|nr:class I SAM-dependent methyltransferase [Ignavibacteriota bacterium]